MEMIVRYALLGLTLYGYCHIIWDIDSFITDKIREKRRRHAVFEQYKPKKK